jgi:hypothetical protein
VLSQCVRTFGLISGLQQPKNLQDKGENQHCIALSSILCHANILLWHIRTKVEILTLICTAEINLVSCACNMQSPKSLHSFLELYQAGRLKKAMCGQTGSRAGKNSGNILNRLLLPISLLLSTVFDELAIDGCLTATTSCTMQRPI